MSEEAAVFELPAAATLSELWWSLGFPLREGGTPGKKSLPQNFVTSGLYRRLDAGVCLFQSYGFGQLDYESDT